ncbi:MAG: putative polysaccharide biosynthesis protein with aminopeptidase-like domain protein [Nitrosomonadaceae bacterium]|nr:putative polysaccharide biosynthesis protein with aminopeptidase-like domain protein [Nitrosomonadaceae bacterium]
MTPDFSVQQSLGASEELYSLATKLYPIGRSLTGNGVRETFKILRQLLPELVTYEVPSGTTAFDWEVPDEWNIVSAQIVGPDNQVIVDYANHNLHVVGYSMPIDTEMNLEELQQHLHSLPDQPDAIPYVTSYYKRTWGFCLPHNVRKTLVAGTYQVRIVADLRPGSLTYGELVLPGETADEILVSTYVCHPSMANNEISGPVVATFLARWIRHLPRRNTYRFIFVPETIGALVYLSRNLEHLQQHTKAGFVVTCCGAPGQFSFMPSRTGTTYADRLATTVLSCHEPNFKTYSFLQRGSDERQYCAPLVNLPVVSVMRSKYHEYPEYHTSLDNLSFITPQALHRTLEVYSELVLAAEFNCTPIATVYGEPQLSRYGLYPTTGGQVDQAEIAMTLDLLALADGAHDLLNISRITGHSVTTLRSRVELLASKNLISILQPQL